MQEQLTFRDVSASHTFRARGIQPIRCPVAASETVPVQHRRQVIQIQRARTNFSRAWAGMPRYPLPLLPSGRAGTLTARRHLLL